MQKKIFIKLRQNTKLPAERWSELRYTQEEAANFIKDGFNVGLVTGDNSFLVIDCDGVDGINEFEKFAKENNINLNTLITTTPRGGRHYFYKWTNSCTGITVYTNFLKSVDVRGKGGYVVVPPSKINNKEYTIYNNVEAIECPEILAQKIKEIAGINVTKNNININNNIIKLNEKEKEILTKAIIKYNIADGINEGERDSTLIKIAGYVFVLANGDINATKKIVQYIYNNFVQNKQTFTQKELESYIFSQISKFDPITLKEIDNNLMIEKITDKNIVDYIIKEMQNYFIVDDKFFIIDKENRCIKEITRNDNNFINPFFSVLDKIKKMIESNKEIYTSKDYEKVYTKIKSYEDFGMPKKIKEFLTLKIEKHAIHNKVVVDGYEYDIKTGEIKDVLDSKEKMYSANIPIKLENKDTPNWDKFLLHVLGNDIKKKEYLEKVLAYTWVGKGPGCGENFIFYLLGEGGTGKTTFINILEFVFGDKLTGRMNHEYFCVDNFTNNHATEAWYDKQFIIADELRDSKINMQKLYELSSGKIVVNKKFKKQFIYHTTASVFLISNFFPEVHADRGVTTDILRRIQPITFKNSKKMSYNEFIELVENVKKERGAILNKLLKIAKENIDKKLGNSPEKAEFDKDLIEMNDYEYGFLHDFFEITNNKEDAVYAGHVYLLYCMFKDEGKKLKDKTSKKHRKKFFKILEDNFGIKKTDDGKLIYGLRYTKNIAHERLMDVEDKRKIKDWAFEGIGLCRKNYAHLKKELRDEYIKIFEYLYNNIFNDFGNNYDFNDGGDDNDGQNGGGGENDKNNGGDENRIITEQEIEQQQVLVVKSEENFDEEEKTIIADFNLNKDTFTKKEVVKMIKDLKNELVSTIKDVIKDVVQEIVKQEITSIKEEKQKEEVKETKEIKKEEKLENQQQQQLNLDIKKQERKDADKEINDFIKEKDITMDKDMQAFANHLKINCNKPAMDSIPVQQNKTIELNNSKEEKREESVYEKLFFKNGEMKPSEEKLKQFEKETFPEVDWSKPPFLKFDY